MIDSIGRSKNIRNWSTFQRRTASNIEKAITIFETSLAVAVGNVRRNRLCRTNPLVASITMNAVDILRDRERESDLIDREATIIQSIVIKDWFGHRRSFRVRVPVDA